MRRSHKIHNYYFDITVEERAVHFRIGKAIMPKSMLCRIFQHGRGDLPAFCDFLHTIWTYHEWKDEPRIGTGFAREVQQVATMFVTELRIDNYSLYCLLREATAGLGTVAAEQKRKA